MQDIFFLFFRISVQERLVLCNASIQKMSLPITMNNLVLAHWQADSIFLSLEKLWIAQKLNPTR